MLFLWILTWFASLAVTIIAGEVSYVTLVETIQVEATAQTVFATPTVPTPASYTSRTDFEETILQVSNEYRDAHGAKALVWNETLVEYAHSWAASCIWRHSGGPYGENLAFGYANASAAVEAWGDEGKFYDYFKPTGFTEETGHFTQLVWKSTEQVGCAAVNCGYTEDFSKRDLLALRSTTASRAQAWYVVCEYMPPGNVVGDQDAYFKSNVWPSYSYPSQTTRSNAFTQSKATTWATSSGPSSTRWTYSTEVNSSGQGSIGATLNSTFFALVMVGIGMGLFV